MRASGVQGLTHLIIKRRRILVTHGNEQPAALAELNGGMMWKLDVTWEVCLPSRRHARIRVRGRFVSVSQISKSYDVPTSLFRTYKKIVLRNIDLGIARGEVLGLVGESGSGKSTLAKCIMGMIHPDHGRITLDNVELDSLSRGALKRFRREIAIVYQNPFLSLNPRMTVAQVLAEPIRAHRNVGSDKLKSRELYT